MFLRQMGGDPAFNRENDVIRTVENLIVVEAQDGKALRFQECIPPKIVTAAAVRFMAISIDLDNDAC